MRIVHISDEAKKDFSKLDGREKSWQKAVVDILKDESNSIEYIEQLFDPLVGDLIGYRKAKNRSFGIRIVFKIISENEIEIFKVKNDIEGDYTEIIDILVAGKRSKVYKTANKRVNKK